MRAAQTLAMALLMSAAAGAQTQLGTAFTYQGQLKETGTPLNGTADFQFRLWDALSGGNQVGATVPVSAVNVTAGLFTVTLDFGAAAFNGDARWLGIAVRAPAGGGSFTTLSPRQPSTAAPYALFSAAPWASSGGNINYMNGNVGIGTATPTVPLAVQGSSSNGGVITGLQSGGSSAGAGVQGVTAVAAPGVLGQALVANGQGVLGWTNVAAACGVYGYHGAASGTGIAVQGVTASPSGYAGYFAGGRNYFDGNIGIGITAPAWPLSMVKPQGVAYLESTTNTNGSVIELRNSAASPNTLGAINFNNAANSYPGQIAYQATNDMTFRTNGNERMRITAAGRVGIGTSSPTATLSATSADPNNAAVYVTHLGSDQPAIQGVNDSTDAYGVGVLGVGGWQGVRGTVDGNGLETYCGIVGEANGESWGSFYGVHGRATNDSGGGFTCGVLGEAIVNSYGTSYGIYGSAPGTGADKWAGWFGSGNVHVTNTLEKGGGAFKIDHPLDPENKYLYHSFVESPDMKNVYDGLVITDEDGLATVTLPDWFEALNRDFRYQLTVIGQFAQAIIAQEIEHSQFSIQTDKPSVKVSWQVTGIRQDPFANANRIQVEADKPSAERGKYLHPTAYGVPDDRGIDQAHAATREHTNVK